MQNFDQDEKQHYKSKYPVLAETAGGAPLVRDREGEGELGDDFNNLPATAIDGDPPTARLFVKGEEGLLFIGAQKRCLLACPRWKAPTSTFTKELLLVALPRLLL